MPKFSEFKPVSKKTQKQGEFYATSDTKALKTQQNLAQRVKAH